MVALCQWITPSHLIWAILSSFTHPEYLPLLIWVTIIESTGFTFSVNWSR
jgi:hypothetical protein